ncbi:bifunctional diguanylate cyclase/phosphodiesterase [Azohydromonas sp.]|uniref:putative bifunctional diguanylate cyclase/phosphodiesterase n=1 Tax=Azohydromonas sp. TaxID=1872666 RepID=UPI002BFEB4AF|nr:bifunctional diguanylate cyclase/phosphodiesterase [Azohydromonas sp.]HMM84840.1 bifunctional diguanylate cyclase/phosphodiesterase [Azohydromonas sp.]
MAAWSGSIHLQTGDALTIGALLVAALLVLVLVTLVRDRRRARQTASLAASLQDANDELHKLAYRDALTDLANRVQFDTLLDRAVRRCDDHGGALAVLLVDLDAFKPVNDTFGHACGDEVLREVARRLGAAGGAAVGAARVGGDEFLLLVDGDRDAAAALAQRVLGALVAPIAAAGREVHVSCSIGIALYPVHGSRPTLLARADAAMFAAKRSGGATYAIFEPSMEPDIRGHLDLARDLRRAIDAGQLELLYQPKIDARSGQVTAAEALLRWHHPQRGLVSPTVFVPIAERHGLIAALGHWVIEDACRQARAWRDAGLRMRVAINLSAYQLRREDLVDKLLDALSRHGVRPAQFTCEITESVAMEDTLVTKRAFERLGAAGMHVSIDDFGTGYSSLAYLRQLPVQELKIDRSFVTDLATSEDARAIVEAVLRMAHALGLKVVAEGVETPQQRDLLVALGCDELQGYLFAKPMPARALTLWATDDGPLPAPIDFRASLYAETAPAPL